MSERQIRLLHDLGLNYGEITIIVEIIEKENIPLTALLRQALREWQIKNNGLEIPEFPASTVTD